MLTLILQRNFSSALKNPTLCSLLHFSISSSAAQTQTLKSHTITDYFIKSCGFSPNRAAAVSKHIGGLRTFGRAESVRHFFKHNGFTDANIRSIISGYPRIIGSDVEHTLQPNLLSLRQMGFSEIELHKLIIRNSYAMVSSSTVCRIKFWKTLLNNDLKSLFLALTRNMGLLCHDIDTSVVPKIAFLKGYGLSDADVRRILVVRSGFFGKSIASMEASLKRVEKLGIQCGSPMFVFGLASLHSVGEDALKSKMKTLMSYGWSEEEFVAALKMHPALVHFSAMNIAEKMEFLVGKVGCKKSYIVAHPNLLSYSLDKRLMPRYHVMNILRLSVSMHRELDLHNIMACSEKIFLQRIIFRYKDQVPTLHDTYIAACSSKIPL